MNSPLANAIMAIQGTNTFVDYEQRLIEAFLMAEEKFKTDDDSAEDKGTPSSSGERLELLSGSDEDAQGSIGEESELEAAEADAVPSSFVEPVELKDAHTSRASWVAEKIGTLPSRFNAVVELRQPPFNIQSPSCGHPEHNAPAPLIIVMSTGTYRKRKSQVPEVIEPAKRVSEPCPRTIGTTPLGITTCIYVYLTSFGNVDESGRASHPHHELSDRVGCWWRL